MVVVGIFDFRDLPRGWDCESPICCFFDYRDFYCSLTTAFGVLEPFLWLGLVSCLKTT